MARTVARIYALLSIAHAMFLAGGGIYLIRYGGHAGPVGVPLLLLSAASIALSPFIWLGHRWAALVTLANSFVPGVWPVLWNQLTGAWKLPVGAQTTVAIAGRHVYVPWWEIPLLAAPLTFAVLTLILFFRPGNRTLIDR